VFYPAKYNYYWNLKNYASAFTATIRQRDSVYDMQLRHLNSCKDVLNPQVYGLLKLDCWSVGQQFITDMFYAIFSVSHHNVGAFDKETYRIAKEYFTAYYKKTKTVFGTDLPYTQSYFYGDFRAKQEKTYAIATNSTDKESFYNKLKFKSIYGSIEKHYPPGPLKDKIRLISFLNVDRTREEDFIQYIDEAVSGAKNSQFRLPLKMFADANQFGKNAFDFNLLDQNKKVIKLKDFKGKLLIVDFWFTGCHACLDLYGHLKSIIESFKNNPNLKFVSICVDKNRQTWLQSLAKQAYTTNDEINLLGENGWQSSIIQFYNIQSFPTLILISKQGKIITTAPPDPRYEGDKFIKMVENNL